MLDLTFEPLSVRRFQIYIGCFMKTVQKLLLTFAAIGLVIGLPVTFSHTEPALAWAFALPAGAVFFGLFLISLVWQKEMAKFDEGERSKLEPLRRYRSPVSDTGNKRAAESPHGPEVTTAHSG